MRHRAMIDRRRAQGALSGKRGNAAVSRFRFGAWETGDYRMRPIYLVAFGTALIAALSAVMIWGPPLTA